MKCTGCGADLPENETICPYCDTKVVPDREQQSIEPLKSSEKPKLGEKIKDAIRASWKKKDLFSKICTVIALFIAILTIVALISKNRGAIILSILQIAALIIAAVLNKEAKDNQKKWVKYVILGVALLLSIANLACYNGNKRPKTSVPEPVVQSETKVCTPCSAKDCIGKTKQEIRNIFLQAGFDNIDEEEIADLDSKELDKDGYVDSVSINGISNFAGNEEFLSTSRVVINYHSFKRVVVPINSERAKTTATEELKKLFSDAGFFNITQKEKVDLDPDITSAEFENTVSINGESEFNDKANFPVNAEIEIVTHKPYEKYTLKIIVDFVQNLLFSKYDVEMNVDGEVTKLNHGEDGEFEYRLKPGRYSIEFTSTESSSVKGTTEIELTGDTEASYKISCYNDKIKVETMYIENGSAVGENEAMIPMAADDCKNKNYQEIEEVFKNAGFTNISLDIVYDISFGITEEGSVKDITVDGKADFKRGEIFAKDVLINIFYHMKAEDDPEKQSSESSDVVEESDNNNNTILSSDTILTKENNEDLAVLLTADAVDGDAQAKFVQKYSGKTIEFDCIVMTLLEEPKYDTIYSYILIPGEDKDSIGATLFYIDRIGFYGFNWDKQTRPEFVASGSRLRLRARVTTGEDTAFIYLEPIKTWGRE